MDDRVTLTVPPCGLALASPASIQDNMPADTTTLRECRAEVNKYRFMRAQG